MSVTRLLQMCTFMLAGLSLAGRAAAQTGSRFAINLSAGVNHMESSVSSYPGVNGGISFTYTPFRLLTFSLDAQYFYMSGKGVSSFPYFIDIPPQNTYYFSTSMPSGGGSIYLNIYELFNMDKYRPKSIPYLVVGMGKNYAMSTARMNNPDHSQHFEFLNYYDMFGIAVRRKFRQRADIVYSLKYYRTQTYYLDALPDPNRYDSYFSLSIAVSNFFVSKHSRSYIDWTPKNICPRMRY